MKQLKKDLQAVSKNIFTKRCKQGVKLTATDLVLVIINTSRKGADVPTLVEKTGLADKQVRNILNRAYKQGRIKRAGRGIYVAA